MRYLRFLHDPGLKASLAAGEALVIYITIVLTTHDTKRHLFHLHFFKPLMYNILAFIFVKVSTHNI
jgi:hypothetical protein